MFGLQDLSLSGPPNEVMKEYLKNFVADCNTRASAALGELA